jgi:hypothetical protein
MGLLLGGACAGSAAAHEELEQMEPPFFSFEIYADGNVRAFWGPSAVPYDDSELERVEVLVPAKIAQDVSDGKLLELLVFTPGSLYGTRCHDQGGGYHCHKRSTPP